MRTIIVQTNYQGIHKYQDAPEQVAFLRNEHRHLFEVSVEIEVFHNDRDIEFFILKEQIDKWIQNHYKDDNNCWYMDNMSCEAVALYLARYLCNIYNDPTERNKRNRMISVSVWEDGENGASVTGRYRDEF